MFSFIKKDAEKSTNNSQVTELGKVSKVTLGMMFGTEPENVRAVRPAFLSEN